MTYYEMHAPIRKKTPAVLAGLALFIAGALSIGGINLLGAYAGFEFLPLLVLAIWPRNAHNLLSLAFVFAAGLFTDWATGVTVGQWALVFTVIWGVMRPELRSTPYAPLSFSAMWFAICGLSLVLVSVSGWFVKGIMPVGRLIMPPSSSQTKIDKNLVTRRTAMLGAGGIGVFGILAARLYQLQVLQAEDYRTLSDNNRFNFNMLLPVRGEIRDRFGVPLAKNRQNYRLIIIPERTSEVEKTLDRVSRISSLSPQQRRRISKDVKQNPSFVPILVKDNVDWETFSALNMRLHALPGIVSI